MIALHTIFVEMQIKGTVLVLAILAVGCSSAAGRHRKNANVFANGSNTGGAILELRQAVALDPRDRNSHAKLGRLEQTMNREGSALVHLLRARELGLVTDSLRFTQLLQRRARQRQRLGHSERWRDLALIKELRPELGPAIVQPLADALLDAGLRRWLAGNRGAADNLWRRITGKNKMEADRIRAVLAEPDKEPLAQLAIVIMRVRGAVGPAAARDLIKVYRSRRGPRLPTAPCPDADVIEVGHPGCAAVIRALAEASTTQPPRHVRLELRSINPVPPGVVGDVVLLVLSQWLWGQRDQWFDAELRAFLLREWTGAPVWLMPTVRRLGGPGSPVPVGSSTQRTAHQSVLAAVEQALSTGAKPPSLVDIKRPLAKVASATLTGGRDLSAWASESLSISVSRFASLAPEFSSTAKKLAASARLDVIEPGWSKTPLGKLSRKIVPSRSGCGEGRWVVWSGAHSSYFAVVEDGVQVFEDFIGDEPSRYCRGVDVAEFYIGQGDSARAQKLAETLLAEDDTDRRGLRVALRAFAVGGNVPRAKQILQDAEYWSGQRGTPSVLAADTFLRANEPVAALAAARSALGLAAPGPVRWDAHELVVTAALQLHRDRDAKRTLDAYLGSVPARLRDDVTRRVVARLVRHGVARPSWIEPEKKRAGLLSAQRAAALSPWAVEPRIALLASAKDKTQLALELLLIGMSQHGPRAARALEAFANVAEANGKHKLATGARQEAALVR